MTLHLVLVGEDALCLSLLRRLIGHVGRGFEEYRSVVAGGASHIRSAVPTYRSASNAVPHVVLTDLDRAVCPLDLLCEWGVVGAPASLLFRVAVREAESWVLADASGFAAFVGIPAKRVPPQPEALADPKLVLVNLARRSRSRRLADELVPPPGSKVPIGPLYNERLGQFVRDHWDPERAAGSAPSLNRAIARLRSFMA